MTEVRPVGMNPEGARRGRPRTGPDPQRTQEVLDAATEVILSKGYDATSMRDIADEVGLLKGSLYYYVKSKEDVLYRILQPCFEAATAVVARVVDSEGDGLEKLESFVRAHVRFIAENRRAFRIMLREFSQLGPERQAELGRSGDSYYDALAEILTLGVRDGDIDPQLDIRLTARTIIGQLNSTAQWFSPTRHLGPDDIGRHLAGIIVSSVASDQAMARRGGAQELRRHCLTD